MQALGMGSTDLGWAEGLNYRMQNEMALLVQYGELEQVGPAQEIPGKPGMVRIPYRRLAPVGTARKARRRMRLLLWGGGGAVYALAGLWALWDARFVLLAAFGILVCAAGVLGAVRALSGGGCSGIHTPGCSCGG